MGSWMHEYRASENKSRSDNLVVIRIQSNVSETRAADETCQGLQLMLKEKKERKKQYGEVDTNPLG